MRVEFLDDPLLKKAIATESLCYKKFKEHKSILILGDCLFQWYERNVEEYWVVVYVQNPKAGSNFSSSN